MKAIKLYYFVKTPNFGDMLSADLIDFLSGKKVMHAKVQHCDCIGIGSLLEGVMQRKQSKLKKLLVKIKPKAYVWGTGFIESEKSVWLKPRRRLKVCAVRGKYSRERLGRYTKQDLTNVVLGDPGLLANRLIDVSKIKKKYKLGIIPHYIDKDNPLLKNIQVENSILIDIQQKPEVVLQQIAECENIISSAMHGLIASDSLGVPNVRMEVSDKICGGDYKFIDYYSAFDMDMPEKLIITPDTKITNVDFIKEQYKITPDRVEKICQNLLRVFPYKK